ncbi:MAG: hypothetical protein WCS33_00285 [Candidatus Caldatribacteriota bacterium]
MSSKIADYRIMVEGFEAAIKNYEKAIIDATRGLEYYKRLIEKHQEEETEGE